MNGVVGAGGEFAVVAGIDIVQAGEERLEPGEFAHGGFELHLHERAAPGLADADDGERQAEPLLGEGEGEHAVVEGEGVAIEVEERAAGGDVADKHANLPVLPFEARGCPEWIAAELAPFKLHAGSPWRRSSRVGRGASAGIVGRDLQKLSCRVRGPGVARGGEVAVAVDDGGRGSRFRTTANEGRAMAEEPVVRYEERDGIAIITMNRPEKMNTLNNDVIQGIADGIDAATASAAVSAVILRGAGRTFTAGYDLNPGDGRRPAPRRYDAQSPEQRPGAWDPVRDMAMMGHNMKRFMKLWECPKPVIAQMHGYALGGGTDLLLCADLIFMAEDAIIGYPPSRVYGTPTTMMWVYRLGLEHAKQFLLSGDQIDAATALRIGLVSKVFPLERLEAETEAYARRFAAIPGNQLALNKLLINQAFENMGLRTTQMFGTLFDGITRHTEEALRWQESFRTVGFRETIRRRDAPFGDYGERPR